MTTTSSESEPDQCTICLQPFLDRAIIPVCAHEFCFECILLWSEQSRKCPLCSRSFDGAYLIHRIRSQYDYQKHYLLPPRSDSPPTLVTPSRARPTRRGGQWGRRERREREEADQLERAISRRRWIYQHHLYAKHVASNQFTRYRPFPTPAQFTASADLISRMAIFLRRELRVWPNLDVEFLTTYTIALMKSIDIRSESAIKLLSEFLDLDTPYAPGARHLNAEHFAHEIYSYLRSPYRDLNMYDQMAQYDIPPGTSPPQDIDIERGNRWSVERSSSGRSRSRSPPRHQSPLPGHESTAPVARRSDCEPSHRHSYNQSPRRPLVSQEYRHPRNHSLDGVEDILRNEYPQNGETSHPGSSNSAEYEDKDTRTQPRLRNDEKGKGLARGDREEFAPNVGTPDEDDSVGAGGADELGVAGPLRHGDGGNPGGGGSSANVQRSRHCDVHVRPRNHTLSESVQAYLGTSPAAARYPAKTGLVSRDKQGRFTSRTDTRPELLLRLSNGPDIGEHFSEFNQR